MAKTMRPSTKSFSNTEKDTDDWVSGDEPMTGAQRSYLKTLSDEAHDPDTFSEDLSKAERRSESTP
jgi:hypothetical protein